MPNLYTIGIKSRLTRESLANTEVFSVVYHDIFDYPLSFPDLIKWRAGETETNDSKLQVLYKNGYYFLEGKEGLIYKRILRERISKKKLGIARKASRVLSFIPTIKMIAVTGSLAMYNSTDESDIDLLVVTQKGRLWITRIISYSLLKIFGQNVRSAGDKNQKDKLCLNMWMDESDLVWKKRDRNVYSAHEIGQILPLINRDKTYEKFLQKNAWILKFWPNSVKIGVSKSHTSERKVKFNFFEKIAFLLQRQYMNSKMTREVVTPTRALFHPQDWGRVILDRLTQV